MTAVTVRPGELDAFAAALLATGSVRLPLDALWPLWSAAVPRLVGDPTQAAALAYTLEELARREVVELPSGAWDTSTTPPLPRSVLLPAARRRPRDRGWMRFPWRRELGWVASLTTLSDTRLHDLIAINDWLAHTDGQTVPVVPLRYRSVELFNDEKHLETMTRTGLFGPGRLSLELLACIRRPAPLAAVSIGPGPDVLVVENSDTYWVAAEALAQHSNDHAVGAVAWGCGKAFPSQVTALGVDVAGRGPVVGTVWYWGDLDPPGIAIAVEAAEMAATVAAPAVKAATALWAAMAERPIQGLGQVDWSTADGSGWLSPQLWARFAPVRDAKGRVAQESVPAEAISRWALEG